MQQHHYITTLLFAICACTQPTTVSVQHTDTPAQRLVLTHIHLEERRNGHTVWSGTADSASGDVQAIDLQNLALVNQSAQGNYSMHTQTGHLLLTDNNTQGDFNHIRAILPSHAVITSPKSHYHEATHTFAAEGPLLYEHGDMYIHATAMTVFLDNNDVQIEGPVTGRIVLNDALAHQ